jgi:hypothetical protein
MVFAKRFFPTVVEKIHIASLCKMHDKAIRGRLDKRIVITIDNLEKN